jgi:hypothetical protein
MNSRILIISGFIGGRKPLSGSNINKNLRAIINFHGATSRKT